MATVGVSWQPSLLASGELAWGGPVVRHHLDADTWVDHAPDWLRGADDLFAHLVAALPWQTGTRPMYDRLVAVPRLSCFLDLDHPVLPPVVADLAAALSTTYDRTFDRVGANLYRHGLDSVAWHADRIGRLEMHPVVALVSLGERRPFLLRPMGGGASRRFSLGAGDLFVMGGACQHRWEHTVPKSRGAGPRLSLGFRHGPVPPDLWRFTGGGATTPAAEGGPRQG